LALTGRRGGGPPVGSRHAQAALAPTRPRRRGSRCHRRERDGRPPVNGCAACRSEPVRTSVRDRRTTGLRSTGRRSYGHGTGRVDPISRTRRGWKRPDSRARRGTDGLGVGAGPAGVRTVALEQRRAP